MDVETLTEQAACEWLAVAAARVPADQAIVEVGVYRGGSLRYLCEGSTEGFGAPVFGIDPWALPGAYPDRPHMLRRYPPENQQIAAKAAPCATLIRDFGTHVADTWDGPAVGLLFIDAVHREPEVMSDYVAWEPNLAPDAVIAFDDHEERFDGVRQAVTRLVSQGRVAPIKLIGNRLAVTTPSS